MRVFIGSYSKYNKKTKTCPDRKISIRIDKYDTWSMDATLSMIILPMLKQLKDTKHGSPFVNDVDVPKKFHSTKDKTLRESYDTDKFFHERWDWVMDELIWTFTALTNDDSDEKFYSGKTDPYFIPFDKDGKKLGPAVKMSSKKKDDKNAVSFQMIKGPKDTFKIDRKGLDKHHARIKNGLMLFGKYYQGLWD